MRLWAALPLALWCSLAAADARQDEGARNAFKVGRAAYETGDYQLAFDKFKESFQLSHEPALLYNIASALQGLKRPHEAAEALQQLPAPAAERSRSRQDRAAHRHARGRAADH